MKTYLHTSILLLFFSIAAFCGYANDNSKLFEEANQAYTKENYDKAIELYQKIVDDGNEGAPLFYDLGNAYYKAGYNAKALLWYERALRLDPKNEDIRHNIAFVNQKITDKIEAVPESPISRWWNGLSQQMNERQWAICSIICAFVLFLAIALYFTTHSHAMRIIGVIAFIVSVVVLVFSIIFSVKEKNRYEKHPEAIVMDLVVNAKSEPTPSSKILFVIHEGLKVEITGEVSGWLEIKLPNGDKGWVPQTEIGKI